METEQHQVVAKRVWEAVSGHDDAASKKRPKFDPQVRKWCTQIHACIIMLHAWRLSVRLSFALQQPLRAVRNGGQHGRRSSDSSAGHHQVRQPLRRMMHSAMNE